MGDQDCYNVAEILTHNKDYLRDQLTLQYMKAKNMTRSEAIEYIEDGLKYKVLEYSKYSIHDLDIAFSDERVKIVIQRLYTKDFYYEH